jgi:hypothetical protein
MISNLFESILEVQSCSGRVERMTKLISDTARRLGAIVNVKDGNVYVTKGNPTSEGYPCIVAHTDTVHDIVPDNQFSVGYDRKNGIIYGYNPVLKNFTGIGGDDKVGIYIALAAVEWFDNIKACFFRDEEIGCIGSGLADMSFFSDCMYVLQCDRRGNADFVTNINGTDISSKDFQDAVSSIITSHGYKFAKGMTTDVGKLTQRNVGVSCANMSCGYYNPHQPEEIIVVDDVHNTKSMVFEIIETITKKYLFTPPATTYKFNSEYYGKSTSYLDDFYEPKSYKWYEDNELADIYFPFDDELAGMSDEDIADYCIAYFFGYEYVGNDTYSYIDEELGVPTYINKKDIEFSELWNMLDDEAYDVVFANANYLEKQRDYLMKDKKDSKCVSCGTTKINGDSKLYYDGMCYACHNEKVYGW